MGQKGMATLINIFPEVAGCIEPGRVTAAAKDFNLHKQFFLVAGSLVVPNPPRQPLNDISDIYDRAGACADEFKHIMQEYTRKGGAEKFDVCDEKSWSRTITKAKDDYKGDVSRVCDVVRGSIYVRSPAQYKKVVNLLLPANNSSVVRFEDGFARPDEDGGLRRVLANIAMSNGHVAEIQVRHTGMEKAYKKTEKLYREIRALRAYLERDDLTNSEQVNASKTLTHKLQKRFTTHENAAKTHKMDVVALDRNLYFVDSFPVMRTFDRTTGEHSAIVPNIQTGTYVTDNRFLPILGDKSRDVKEGIPREAWIARSIALVTSPQAKAALQLA